MRCLVLFFTLFIWIIGNSPLAHGVTQEAGIQTKVHVLTAGILAGSLKPGQRNGPNTEATFNGPRDIAVDSKGNVFVVDDSQIRKITPDGRVSAFAGSTRGYMDGPGEIAKFGTTMLGIAIDASDNIYVADSQNRRIRKITPNGYVSTLAGSTSGYADNWGVAAQFSLPRGIAVDSKGNVYIGDDKNNKIRKITPNGDVITLARRSEFSQPRSIAVDGQDNVYVLDGVMIKKITPDDSVLLMAGNMKFDTAANKDNRAKFSGRGGLAADKSGNLYVSSTKDKKVYKISPDGDVYIMAGIEQGSWVGRPNNITVGANGNIYIADDHNHLVHQITPAGNIGPLPGLDIPKSALVSASSPIQPEVAYVSAVKKKENAALFAATKAKSKKDPVAQLALADMYYDGRGVTRDQSKAIKWYKKAAKKNVAANYILGNIYAGRRDESRAIKYYKKAAKKGHAGAQYEYGRYHYNGKILYWRVVTDGNEAAADAAQILKRYKNANEWNLKSAAQGNDKAQFALGLSYLRGEAIDIDNAKAIDYLTKAAEQENIDAQFELAEIYRKGEITKQDHVSANTLYTKVAASGDVYSSAMQGALTRVLEDSTPIKQQYVDAGAQTLLGLKYYSGYEVEQDYAKAAELFDSVVMLGEINAQWMMGKLYEMGEGVDQDYDQAHRWYNIAAALGHSEAQFRLGYLYYRGYGVYQNVSEAIYWFRKAAKQGNVKAQLCLASLYADGEGVMQDYSIALGWYNMAAELGDVQAQYDAGLMYSRGQGTEIDDAKFMELYTKAAVQGHSSASKFISIYKKANEGDANSQNQLAAMYFTGLEVRQDYPKSLKWMTKGAEQGHVNTQYMLGTFLLYDWGEIEKDYKLGLAWLTVATENGHKGAKEMLETAKNIKFRENFGDTAGDIRAIVQSLKSKKKKKSK